MAKVPMTTIHGNVNSTDANPLIPTDNLESLSPEERARIESSNAVVQAFMDRESASESEPIPQTPSPNTQSPDTTDQAASEGGQSGAEGSGEGTAAAGSQGVSDPLGGQSPSAPTASTPDQPSADDDDGDDGDTTLTPEAQQVRYQVLDREFDTEEAAAVIGLWDWARTLPPEAQQIIDAALSGEYDLVPRNQPPTPSVPTSTQPQYQVQYQQPTPQSAPPTPPIPTIPQEDWEALDPAVQQALLYQQQVISDLQTTTQQFAQTQYQQQEAQALASIESGIQSFATEFSLSDSEVQQLAREFTRRQFLPYYLQTNNNDYSSAVVAGLRDLYYADPIYREREARRTPPPPTDSDDELARRRANATALAASGGNTAPRGGGEARTEPPPNTNSPNARRSGIAAAIVEARNNGG